MIENYAVEINSDGVVSRVIVGDAKWANEMLGGIWIDSDILVGPGWSYDGTTFEPPYVEPEPDEELEP